MTLRAIYERRKEHFLNEKGRVQEEENGIKPQYSSLPQLAKDLETHYDKLPRRGKKVHRGRLSESIRQIRGFTIKDRDVSSLAAEIEATPAWKLRIS